MTFDEQEYRIEKILTESFKRIYLKLSDNDELTKHLQNYYESLESNDVDEEAESHISKKLDPLLHKISDLYSVTLESLIEFDDDSCNSEGVNNKLNEIRLKYGSSLMRRIMKDSPHRASLSFPNALKSNPPLSANKIVGFVNDENENSKSG